MTEAEKLDALVKLAIASQKGEKPTYVAEVVRVGDKLLVPESMPLPAAVEILQKQIASEEEMWNKASKMEGVFPWDGALALHKALKEVTGFATSNAGWSANSMISVEVDLGMKVDVPWGRFAVPGGARNEFMETSYDKDASGLFCFVLTANARRKFAPVISRIFALTEKYARDTPVYKGKAFRIKFLDEYGDMRPFPEVNFLDFTKTDLSTLCYNADLEEAIESEVITPIRHREKCKKLGTPSKRGVLLAGPYGTGKTLLAYKVALEAIKNGWTFMYVSSTDELSTAMRFSKSVSPCVIFAEDIDRVMEGHDRTLGMDAVLNIIDGVDTKDSEMMVILTTNHLDSINKAMLRPGRLDTVLVMQTPDAATVVRLIQKYGKGHIHANADLSEAGNILAGCIPAVVREAVERAKLQSVARDSSQVFLSLTTGDLVKAAKSVMRQVALTAIETDKPEFVRLNNLQVELPRRLTSAKAYNEVSSLSQ